MTKYLLAAALLTTTALSAQEGPTTQALVAFDSKATVKPTPQNVTLKVDNRQTPLTSLTAVPPTGVQVALLIDDGLRSSVGRELNNLKAFVSNLPPGVEILIGYMQNGRVAPATRGFTANHAAAAATIRIPLGSPGLSSSPYFCLSDIIKSWPGAVETEDMGASSPSRKARIVLMITNGVDPYNGSTNITNQNSPYVDTAVRDAQRAGIPVYSIYFTDAGFRGRGTFSGQSYLSQVAENTGGISYYLGTGNPVSLAPFLNQFKGALAETYIATFPVEANKKTVSLKIATSAPKTKLRGPDQVRPGTIVFAQ